VFQSYALYPHMTVRENMAFALRLAKEDEAKIKERVDWAADILDLKQHLDRKPGQLSGGQRQRVAMGRVIVRTPNAFLMDEPLSNLDAKLRVQMRTEVSRLQKRLGTTTVYVTHDQVEAMTLGDRVAVMRAGEIQQVDSPEVLYEHPTNLFVAGFIGSPSMNFLPATAKDGTLQTPLGELQLPADRRRGLGSGEREVIIGIRPEHFEDASLVGADKRDRGATVTAKIDLLESLGSDKFAYFTVQSARATAEHLQELAADAGTGDLGAGEEGVQVTARLDAASKAAEDQELEIWLDLEKVHVFDPESGENLTLADGAAADRSEAKTTVQPAVPAAEGQPAEEPEAESAGPGPDRRGQAPS
jgi:multiple sugar transport system ATP-binding protein